MRTRGWSAAAVPLALLLPGLVAGQQPAAQSTQPSHKPVATVVLVELDGFRWDYAARDDAKNLLAMGKRGAWAPQGMLPSYPAQSAPNQFTLVTGLYPGHHGIVADSFIDPAKQARFASDNPDNLAEGSWYSGTPLWSVAERQGVRTACLGWIGCTAQIAGFRPGKVSRNDQQPGDEVRQILDWLHLPAAWRPRLIAAHFREPGETVRRFGPDARQARTAVQRIDAEIGRLQAGLNATGLPIDLVVVSDRGMATPDGGWITLDQYADLSGFDAAGTLLYGKTEADRERVYNQTKKATSEFFVYRAKNLPADLDDRNDRVGDPVIVATGAYAIRARAPATATDAGQRIPVPLSVDGFDARLVPQMKAIFFAAGPDIVKGTTVAPFRNVNLYAWLGYLLGLTPPKSDGNLNILSGTLSDNGETGKYESGK